MRLRQKLFLILFSLLAACLLLEVSLGLGGRIYYSYRIKNDRIQREGNNLIKILCLGDSYTFGAGAPKNSSYPEQLQRLLDGNESKKFIIYNAGVPGNNSSQLFKNLEGKIAKYQPDIIVAMTGANNNNNFTDSNCFLFVGKSPRFSTYRLDAFLSRLRSYKLFKAIGANFYSKIKPRRKINQEFFVDDLDAIKRSGDKANNNEIKNISAESIEEMGRYLDLAKFHKSQNKFSLAAEAFKKAVAINPSDENAHLELFYIYYKSGQINLALEELNVLYRLNPRNEWVGQFRTSGIPNFKDTKAFVEMLEFDLKNVIALINSQGIKLILQNYPVCWPNESLKQIAKINGIPFVDNQFVFEKIASADGYQQKDYFDGDGHCNEKGYRIIAENVYSVLSLKVKGLLE